MYCTHCGSKVKDKDNFCPKCGEKLQIDDVAFEDESDNIVDEMLNNTTKAEDTAFESSHEDLLSNTDTTDSNELRAGFAIWRIITVALYVGIIAYISIYNPTNFMADLYWPVYFIPLTIYWGDYEFPWLGFFVNTIVTTIVASITYILVYHYFSTPLEPTNIIDIYTQKFVDENTFFRFLYHIDAKGVHYTYLGILTFILIAPIAVNGAMKKDTSIIDGTSTNGTKIIFAFLFIGSAIGINSLQVSKNKELYARYDAGLAKVIRDHITYRIDKKDNNYSDISNYFLENSRLHIEY